MARFVAIAILIAIAAGVYAFSERSSAENLRLQLAKSESDLALFRKRSGEYTAETKAAQTALAECTTKTTELQTALEAAATKKPAPTAKK